MDKKEYILQQFKRTWNKKYENYCIERIINKIDNLNLQFVTQQMFRREGGGIALADLYFPQLKLTIEIDENHHLSQKEKDEERTDDIIKALNRLESVLNFTPEEIRVDVAGNKSIEEINTRLDEVIGLIQERIKQIGKLVWDVSIKPKEFHINRGFIEDDGSAVFKYASDISWLFGKNYKDRAQNSMYYCVDKQHKKIFVWCPILSIEGFKTNIRYENRITTDGRIIYESDTKNNTNFLKEDHREEIRYVFAKYKLADGKEAYVFKGVYGFNEAETKKVGRRVWVKNQSKTRLDIKKNKNRK